MCERAEDAVDVDAAEFFLVLVGFEEDAVEEDGSVVVVVVVEAGAIPPVPSICVGDPDREYRDEGVIH